MARLEARVFGFVVAVLVLVLAVGLLGWSNHRQAATNRRLRGEAGSNSARVGQLEGQLRDHGIEPAPVTTTTTTVHQSSRTTTTNRRTVPVTVPAASPTTTTTVRPSPPSTTTTTAPPPSTTSTTQCIVRLSGQCAL